MSDMQTPGTRALSPWWALLILPVALFIGWGFGQLPAPNVKQPTTTVSQNTVPVSTPAGPTRAISASPGTTPTGGAAADLGPPSDENAADEEPSALLSQWSSLESAMSESQRNGKPVLIDFNADWCGPCQRMKQELFDNWTLGHAVQTAVIPVSIVDRKREDGRNPPEIESLQQRFEVDAFPTLVVFSPASGRITKTKGYGDAERTLAWIRQAAASVR